MEILIVAATSDEVQPTFDHCTSHWIQNANGTLTRGQATVRFLISGPGMYRMAYAMGRSLGRWQFDLCINAGIAGVYPGKGSIGDVVHVTEEIVGDLGSEDRDGSLLTFQDIALQEDLPSTRLLNEHAGRFDFLPAAVGITVNTTSGTERTINERIRRYDPGVETMEGAAFFYCCLKEEVEFIELRGISNVVEPRDSSRWQIPQAIEALNAQLIEMINLLGH
ncbi:MAG: futalosine hydrolase [Saprospiraceae bacterium]|nr:futalosine hydrolase [Saprospiraceae bacterium]